MTVRPKILHVITDLRVGGESKLLVRSIAGLPMFEHVVGCLALTSDPVNAPSNVASELEGLGVRVVDLGVRRDKPLSVGRAFVRLVQLARRERPDVVHSTLIHANLLSQPLAWAGQTVLCSHGVTKPWRRPWHRRLEHFTGRRAIFVANARAVEDTLAEAGFDRDRIRVLYYGVDDEHFRPDGERAEVEGDPLLVGVGRLHEQKGFHTLVEAAARLPEHPHVLLVGDGPLRASLERRAREFGVPLTIEPAVGDIAPYLRRADVVALPSLWEGLPNVLLEALASGCTVVASDLPGHREAIRDGDDGFLFPPGNVAALSAALAGALGDDGSLGATARQTMIERFRWRTYLDRRRLLYESMGQARRAVVGAREDTGLVVVVPKAGSDVDEHFAHTFRFADHLARHLRTAVIVERSSGAEPEAGDSVEVRIQRRSDRSFVLRAAELLWLAVGLSRQGFRTYYVRTSQTAAVPLIFARRMLGGRVLYWSCGKNPKSRLRELGLGYALRHEIPMRAAFRWADLVVTGTPSLAEHYSRTYRIPRNRIAVVPNEIDLDRFRPPTADERDGARAALGVAKDERLVLAVHRFSPVRRTLTYVPVVPRAVLERHGHVRFALAGGGPEEAEVRQAVAAAHLTDCVRLLGSVPHERIRELYAAADIFVMPSYTEGFPRVLLEAMATGVPIASTDVGGVREILPDAYHARLADRDRPLELASALDELLRDPETAHELAALGLQWVRRYDAPSVARELAELARR